MEKARNIFVLFAVFGLAFLMLGLINTWLIFKAREIGSIKLLPGWTGYFMLAASAMGLHLMIRFLKWHIILRRHEVFISMRTSLVSFLAGLAVNVPLLVPEAYLRSYIIYCRENASFSRTFNLYLMDRFLDAWAIAVLAFVCLPWNSLRVGLLVLVVLYLVSPGLREMAILFSASFFGFFLRLLGLKGVTADPLVREKSRSLRVLSLPLLLSLVAWVLPALMLYILSQAICPLSISRSFYVFSRSTLVQIPLLASGGIVITGTRVMRELMQLNMGSTAVLLTALFRVSTYGFALFAGLWVLVIYNRRLFKAVRSLHFNTIAQVYDVQLKVACRQRVVRRKIDHMMKWLDKGKILLGLDAGCGQGYYIYELGRQGYEVLGVESARNQLAFSKFRLQGRSGLASLPELPFVNHSFDFVYTINVLHHIKDPFVQKEAIAELLRVTRPKGLVFIHEINTRNPLFRFYMNYVFPVMNNIDEGTERWLLPDLFEREWAEQFKGVAYFTFMPDFTPNWLWQIAEPLEKRLVHTSWRIYSAHYMAVLQKDD